MPKTTFHNTDQILEMLEEITKEHEDIKGQVAKEQSNLHSIRKQQIDAEKELDEANSRLYNAKEELEKVFPKFKKEKGPSMLVVKVKKGARSDLGRPSKTPIEYKEDFMKSLLDSK